MRRKGRPKKQKAVKGGKRGRPKKSISQYGEEPPVKRQRRSKAKVENEEPIIEEEEEEEEKAFVADSIQMEGDSLMRVQPVAGTSTEIPEDFYSEGLHMSTMQVRALSQLISCKDCGEEVTLGVRPTTKGMISEFTVICKICGSTKSTNTPNLIRERKRKREKKGVILQKNENINYAHVAAFLDNGLGFCGLRHYCKYFNARCLNEATFIVYAKQVIADAVTETEEFLQQNARIVRKAFETQMESDLIIDLTVAYTTTYHQWGSDFCLVAGAVIELQTGLVVDYDVGNMYCHVCKINARKIVSMTPVEMTEWFNKHQDTCEIREWCDEIDQDSEEGIKEVDPKYLEAFIAKKIWARSMEKFGFRYTTLIHESDERIHAELLKSAPYGDIPVLIDTMTNCFSRRKSEHARTSFQNKLKSKCPRERVQTKDRIMYVYSTSIPEYNKFAIGSNIKLRELVRQMEIEEEEYAVEMQIQAAEIIPTIVDQEEKTERHKIVEQVEGSELEALQQELDQVMAAEAAAEQERAELDIDPEEEEEEEEELLDEEEEEQEINEQDVDMPLGSPIERKPVLILPSEIQTPVTTAATPVVVTTGVNNSEITNKASVPVVLSTSTPISDERQKKKTVVLSTHLSTSEKSNVSQPKKSVVLINADVKPLSKIVSQQVIQQQPIATNKQPGSLENGKKTSTVKEVIKPFRVELDDE